MSESVMSQQVVVAGASLRAGANNTTSAVTVIAEKEVRSERKRVVTVMDEFDGGSYNEKDERKAGQHVISTECDATGVAAKAYAPQRCYSNTSSNSNSSTTTTTTMTMSGGSTSSSTCRTSEWIETGTCVESAGHTTTSCCPLSAAPHAPLPVRFIASTNMSSVGGATQSSRTEGPQTPRSNSSSLEQEDAENEEEEENNEVRSRHVRSESDTTPSAASRCSTGEETTNVTRTTAQSLPCGTRCVPHVNNSEALQDSNTGRTTTTTIVAQGLPCHGPLMQPQRRSSLHTGQMLMCNLHYVVCDDEAYRPVMGKDAKEEKEESSRNNTEKANGQRSEKSGANNNKDSEEHRHHGACLRHHTPASTCDKCSRSPGTTKENRRGSLTSTKTHYAFSSLAASHEGKTHRLMLLSEPSSEPLPPPPPPPPPPPQTQQVQQPSHVSTRTEVTKMTNVIIAPAETSSPQEGSNTSNTSSATSSDASRQPFVMRADPATMKELHQGKVPRMPGYSMVDWAARLARERARGMPARRQLTVDEVAQHNTLNDIWIVVDDVVYDITEFQHYHPGGEALFRRCAGRDATELFYACHAWISCSSMLRPFAVGVLKR